MAEQSQTNPNRPGCLLVLVAIFALYQIVRVPVVLQQADLFNQQLSVSPIAQAGIASLWAVIFISCAVGLAIANPIALRYSKWLLIAFILYRTGHYAIFARADYDRQRIVFVGIVIALIIIVMSFNIVRQREVS